MIGMSRSEGGSGCTGGSLRVLYFGQKLHLAPYEPEQKLSFEGPLRVRTSSHSVQRRGCLIRMFQGWKKKNKIYILAAIYSFGFPVS